jgi:hypothetical protein
MEQKLRFVVVVVVVVEKTSVASVRKRNIPNERPSLVSEVSANFLRIKGATWSA